MSKKKKLVFSLKTYLQKKAAAKALKLQFREARRAAKKNGQSLTLADYLASLQPQQPHTHTHDHNHVHGEEALVVHEDEVAQTTENP